MSVTRNISIRVVQLAHLVLIIYLVLGGVFPFILVHITTWPDNYLWFGIAHIGYLVLILFHWKTNHNRCYLTDLEAFLKQIPVQEMLPFTQRVSISSSKLSRSDLDSKHQSVLRRLVYVTALLLILEVLINCL